jgi:hypothetical protein
MTITSSALDLINILTIITDNNGPYTLPTYTLECENVTTLTTSLTNVITSRAMATVDNEDAHERLKETLEWKWDTGEIPMLLYTGGEGEEEGEEVRKE